MATPALRILLVEDHLSTNSALTKTLRLHRHTVHSAKDAEAALKLMEENRDGFDLLISDIGLPDTNGWELLRKLRARQPDLRAIALTGYGFPNDMKRSNEAGFNLHLTKPMDWLSIEKAIASLFPAPFSKPPSSA